MSRKSIESIEDERPAIARADIPPTDGYSVEVDGKLKAHFPAQESAFEAGVALKTKFPFLQVKIYDGKERMRTPVDLPNADS